MSEAPEPGEDRLVAEAEEVEGFLRDEGWRFTRLTSDTWRLTFRGRGRTFPLLLWIDPSGWMTVAVVPLLRSPEGAAAAPLYQRMLELNHVLYFAKFSIDDDLDVVLSVEYPVHELDRSELRAALDALGYYADQHYDELAALVPASTPPSE